MLDDNEIEEFEAIVKKAVRAEMTSNPQVNAGVAKLAKKIRILLKDRKTESVLKLI